MHRDNVQKAPLSAMAVAFTAVGGPLIGSPCWLQLVPSEVAKIEPVEESTMQFEPSVHATPFSASVVPLVSADQVEPVLADLRIVPEAPAA
jgi:hypothetical protein